MHKKIKPALLAATLVISGGLATACGGSGGSGAPTDASVDAFCKALLSLDNSVAFNPDSTSDEKVKAAHDLGDALAKVGTPKDIPAEARKGFELVVTKLKEADKADVENANFEDSFTAEEKAQGEAFSTYSSKTCMSSLMPSDLPTELPSDFPTDLPSDLPSDLLSDLPTGLPS